MKYTYIYALVDPRDISIRYVGKSDNPYKRLTAHIRPVKSKKTYKHYWIAKLSRLGLNPDLIILEKVQKKIWEDREKFWIKHARYVYGDLMTNTADGGGRNTYHGKYHPMYGRKHTATAKKLTGQASKKRNAGKGNPMYGLTGSDSPLAKQFLFELTNNTKCVVYGQMDYVSKNAKISLPVLYEFVSGKRYNYRGIKSIQEINECIDKCDMINLRQLCEYIKKQKQQVIRRSKKYKIKFYDQNKIIVENLLEFSRQNFIPMGSLHNCCSKKISLKKYNIERVSLCQ